MQSIIITALQRDRGAHDQVCRRYTTDAETVDSLVVYVGENLSKIESVNNNEDGGMVYNFEENEKELKIYFQSPEKVNGYFGYSLFLSYKENEKRSIFNNARAINYSFCKPSWIKNGLREEDLKEHLSKPEEWLIPEGLTRLDSLSKVEKTVVAWMVDKLLDAKKKNQKAKCGFLINDKANLEQAQKLVKVVLGLLPMKLSNRCSYNLNSNSGITGLDIFCSTVKEIQYNNEVHLIQLCRKEGTEENFYSGNFEEILNNSYAEYVKDADNQIYEFLDGYENVSKEEYTQKYTSKNSSCEIIKELNGLVGMVLLERQISKKIDTNSIQELCFLRNSYEACQNVMSIPDNIEKEITAIAYRIFFSDELSISFSKNSYRQFFEKFIKTKYKYTDINSGTNAFIITDNWMPQNVEKEYLQWLWLRIEKNELIEEVNEKSLVFFEIFKNEGGNYKDFLDTLTAEKLDNFFIKIHTGYILEYLKTKLTTFDLKKGFYENHKEIINTLKKDNINDLLGFTVSNIRKQDISDVWKYLKESNKLSNTSFDEWEKFLYLHQDSSVYTDSIMNYFNNFWDELDDDTFQTYIKDCSTIEMDWVINYICKRYLNESLSKKISFFTDTKAVTFKDFITEKDFKEISDFQFDDAFINYEEIEVYIEEYFNKFIDDCVLDDKNFKEIETTAKKLKITLSNNYNERKKKSVLAYFDNYQLELDKILVGEKLFYNKRKYAKAREKIVAQNLCEREKEFLDKLKGSFIKFYVSFTFVLFFIIAYLSGLYWIAIKQILESYGGFSWFIKNQYNVYYCFIIIVIVVFIILFIYKIKKINKETGKSNNEKEVVLDAIKRIWQDGLISFFVGFVIVIFSFVFLPMLLTLWLI